MLKLINMRKKAFSADNQQGSEHINRYVLRPSETTRRAPLSKEGIEAYLFGALHDGTFSSNKRFRISQKGTEWLKFLQRLFKHLGYNAWIYKEGKDRKVYVLETLANFLDFNFNPLMLNAKEEKVCYIRGFFDSLADSQNMFLEKINSWHPRKIKTLKKRMKI